MNTTIQKIDTIIDNFDKAYDEWMDKEEASLEEVMQIFKKYYYEFDELYDDNVDVPENTLIADILGWISDTVGELYIDWETEVNEYYEPGKELKSIVEKFVQS